MPNVAHILLDTLGGQHVILRCGGAYMQVVVSGRVGVIAPMVLGIRIEESEGIGAVAKQLAKLNRLLAASPDAALPPWTAQTLNLRDALIALDGDRAGATLPEIAAVIYGWERIERDWPGRGLRDRVRRALQRGQVLCEGGYRGLLR